MGVVGGGEFILLLFIGVMATGCWSDSRGGCFCEVSSYVEINQGHLVWLLLLIEVLLYRTSKSPFT